MIIKKDTKTISLNAGSDTSNLLELALENMNYPRERIIHYTFLVEDAISAWKEALPSLENVTFTRISRRFDEVFVFECEGEKVNPFEYLQSSKDDTALKTMFDRLISGVGSELKYRYKKKNILTLTLPKQNQEKTLFKRTLLMLMIPITFQALVENIATCIDALMLGFQTAEGMSGVSFASSFNFIHFLIIIAVVTTETLLISQYWGKRDRATVSKILNISVFFAYAISVLFFVAALCFPEQIMRFYTNSDAIIEEGAKYLKIVSFSYLLIPLYCTFYGYMRTVGFVKLTFIYTLAGCIINVILNSVLIFGLFGVPSLGVTGAGIATLASAAVQAVLILVSSRKIRIAAEKTDKVNAVETSKILKSFISKILPVLAQYSVYLLVTNIYSSVVGHLGDSYCAANSLAAVVFNIFFCTKNGVSQGSAILIGAKLGRGELESADRNSRVCYSVSALMGLIVGVAFTLTCFLLRFTPLALDDEAMRSFNILAVACGVNLFFGYINAVSCFGCLLSGGKAIYTFITDTVILAFILVPLILIGRYAGFIAPIPILCIMHLDELFTCPLKYFFVRQKKWLRNLTK